MGPSRERERKVWTGATRQQAQDELIEQLLRGSNIAEALRLVGRSRRAYDNWRRDDPEFRRRVDVVRRKQGHALKPWLVDGARGDVVLPEGLEDPRSMTFEQFSAFYLGQRVFPHMGNVVDLLEGRPPRWLHPSMTYGQGEPDLVLVNVPPEHGKTVTLTINYVVYRICMDPSIRVIIVSKTQPMAKKMLLAIKNRLTHERYAKLIADFAPIGGFDAESDSWTTEMIYVGGRDVEQKDPTAQAIGIGGQIYGSRADLIIMDDTVDLKNAHQHEDQIYWIESEVQSRISSDGALLVVGTRLAGKDLYSELPDPKRFPDGESPWTLLRMPALLESADDPKDWVTLWPYTNTRERGLRADDETPEGLWPKWDGPRLAKKRKRVTPATWARVYQQQQTSEETVFQPEDVRGCTNGNRNVGRIGDHPLQRVGGMDGLIVVAGLDPATSGFTAAVVEGLDLRTQRRYVLDVRNRARLTPDQMRGLIYELTDRYQIVEWVIEKNGFQGFLVQDREVNAYLSSRGCIVRPHFTGDNKRDPDFGVAAMSGLFKGHEQGHNLIELPSAHMSEGVKALVEQLVSWTPNPPKGQKTDTVMALWMAELACQRRIEATTTYGARHVRNPFLTRHDANQRLVLDVAGAHEMWKAVGT